MVERRLVKVENVSPIETAHRDLVAELDVLASLTAKLENRLTAVMRPDSGKKQAAHAAPPIGPLRSATVEMLQHARATVIESSFRLTDILSRLEL